MGILSKCTDLELSICSCIAITKVEVPGQNTDVSKITDFWPSKTEFCHTLGGASTGNSFCFNGNPVTLNETATAPEPKGICLEKVSSGSYVNMVAHPDESNRAFFSSLAGKIWLASIPDQDSGNIPGLDESSPFVDLADQVYLDTTFGMMGMAFHPNFARNGRFFASFNCDREMSSGCGGRCSCNSDIDCDPSQLDSIETGSHCKYHAVVADCSVFCQWNYFKSINGRKVNTTRSKKSIYKGLPFTSNHGGQIIFGPADGYLYIMMGDGEAKAIPIISHRIRNLYFGKIIRVDIDTIPSKEETVKLNLWGKYYVSQDNPSSEDPEMAQEIWAYGLTNPWHCSFDSERPSYFLCADIGQDQYEEVNIISKGGNYEWRAYEGPQTWFSSYIWWILLSSQDRSMHSWKICTQDTFGQHQKHLKTVATLQPVTYLLAVPQILVPNSNSPALQYIFHLERMTERRIHFDAKRCLQDNSPKSLQLCLLKGKRDSFCCKSSPSFTCSSSLPYHSAFKIDALCFSVLGFSRVLQVKQE